MQIENIIGTSENSSLYNAMRKANFHLSAIPNSFMFSIYNNPYLNGNSLEDAITKLILCYSWGKEHLNLLEKNRATKIEGSLSWRESEPSFGEPEHSWRESEPSFGEPEHSWHESEPSFGEPEHSCHESEPSFGKPEHSSHESEQRATQGKPLKNTIKRKFNKINVLNINHKQ